MPDAFLASGGGDCEDWAMFLALSLKWIGVEDLVLIGIGKYPGNPGPIYHALVVFAGYDPPFYLDPMYYWIPPAEVTRDFSLEYLYTPRELFDACEDVVGTDWDVEMLKKMGWIE